MLRAVHAFYLCTQYYYNTGVICLQVIVEKTKPWGVTKCRSQNLGLLDFKAMACRHSVLLPFR